MTDYFAVLDQPRRAWLDQEALRAKFLALSNEVHPDRVHSRPEPERAASQKRYTELNAAYQCLRETKSRLQHLLELERGGKLQDVQKIPPETMDLFFRVGKLCGEVDDFLDEKRQGSSPLIKVQLFERAQDWHGRLEELAAELRLRIAGLEEHLKSGPDLARVEAIFRLVSYYERWCAQLRERCVQLAMD